MIDYYALLGVSPEASLSEIKAAFRRKAMDAHPDRGGTHEEMTRLNEAWEVLSDPRLRAAYDRARTNGGSAADSDWQREAEGVHERASDYPRDWAGFERWLDALAEDVRRAEYGRTGTWFFIFPTAGQSKSGWLCIVGGAAAAGVFCWTKEFYRGLVLECIVDRAAIPGALVLALPLMAGAWGGYHVHRFVRDGFRDDEERAARRRQRAPGAETGRATQVVPCGRCGTRLRVPSLDKPLEAKCPGCGDRVAVDPA